MELIKLYATWCGPCKVLEKTLHNSDIKYTNINIEDEEGEEVCEKYKVTSVPTLLFIGNNGNLLHRINGNVSLSTIKDIIEKYENQ